MDKARRWIFPELQTYIWILRIWVAFGVSLQKNSMLPFYPLSDKCCQECWMYLNISLLFQLRSGSGLLSQPNSSSWSIVGNPRKLGIEVHCAES